MSGRDYTFHSEQLRCLVDAYREDHPESCASYDEMEGEDTKMAKKVATKALAVGGAMGPSMSRDAAFEAWLRTSDVEDFLEEKGDEKVRNPNPDGKKEEVKVKSLPDSEEGKGLLKKLYDKWKKKLKGDPKDKEKKQKEKALKNLQKSPSKKEVWNLLTETSDVLKDKRKYKDLTDEQRKQVNDIYVKKHLPKIVDFYYEKATKPKKKPSMKELAEFYSKGRGKPVDMKPILEKVKKDKKESSMAYKIARQMVRSSLQAKVADMLVDILAAAGTELVHGVREANLAVDLPTVTESKGHVAVEMPVWEEDPDPRLGGGSIIARFTLWYDGSFLRLNDERGRKIAGWADNKSPSAVSKGAARVMRDALGF